MVKGVVKALFDNDGQQSVIQGIIVFSKVDYLILKILNPLSKIFKIFQKCHQKITFYVIFRKRDTNEMTSDLVRMLQTLHDLFGIDLSGWKW